jgi:hypothetical protein
MQIIDIPVFNEDGSVQFTQKLSADEAKELLTFAINFLANTGYQVHMQEETHTEFDD